MEQGQAMSVLYYLVAILLHGINGWKSSFYGLSGHLFPSMLLIMTIKQLQRTGAGRMHIMLRIHYWNVWP